MINSGFTQQWDFSKKIRDFLQVTVIKLYTSEDTPFIIIQIKNTSLFQFAIDNGIINLSLPMVLDPLFKDFESDELENVLRLIGGKSSIRTNR
jgi:hypothetical protein